MSKVKSIEDIRQKLWEMDQIGADLDEMETFMSDEAIKGGIDSAASLVRSAYLSTAHPDKWLEDFINENL